MIVLSEASDQLPSSTSSHDLNAMTGMAKLMGFQVYYILGDVRGGDARGGETAEAALSHIPQQSSEELGIWLGYVPSLARYQAIYNAALNRGIRLINTPKEHQIAQELDQAYPFLNGLTPMSVVLTHPDQCEAAIAHLGLPVFVRGVVRSHKEKGWSACVAKTVEELQQLVTPLLELEEKAIVRQFVNLRHTRTASNGFPLGREYRVFVYNQQIVTYGYYWEGEDELKYLTVPEEEALFEVALKAAHRLNVPFLTLDIGQMVDEQWMVIESGDAQFSAASQVPLLQLWHQLSLLIAAR